MDRAVRAVVFDLDGVLLDSEHLWDEARRRVVARHGGTWGDGATTDMQGMSAPEWSAYLRDRLGVPLAPERIDALVVDELLAFYRRGLPLLPGAVRAVRALSGRWPLGLASSSNRRVIDVVLAEAGLDGYFAATVSSEEVGAGKPDPAVYLEAARRLGQDPRACVAIEDSANGVRSAAGAGMAVLAVPDPRWPPPPDVLGLAAAVLDSLTALTPEVVESVGRRSAQERRVDEEEVESFPASDPHSDWAGPPG